MKKGKLLSIGELSKQTGVHIKSLRYYDHLGILRPVYVDPDSGYRYYDLHQIPVVDAIQLCIDLDIPLKRFTDYYTESSHQLHYAKLVEHGTALAREKISSIQARLESLEQMRAEIMRGELLLQSGSAEKCWVPAMDVWLVPCLDRNTASNVSSQFHSVIRMVDNIGLKISYGAGILLRCRKDQQECFFYIGVEIPKGVRGLPENIFHVPEGEYLCLKQEKSNIWDAANIFPEQFALDYEKIIIESELSLMDYDYVAPPYEIRCLLPNQQI